MVRARGPSESSVQPLDEHIDQGTNFSTAPTEAERTLISDCGTVLIRKRRDPLQIRILYYSVSQALGVQQYRGIFALKCDWLVYFLRLHNSNLGAYDSTIRLMVEGKNNYTRFVNRIEFGNRTA